MPNPPLREPFATLSRDLLAAMVAGLHDWRPDLNYPESHSDMQACVLGILSRFELTPRVAPLDLKDMIRSRDAAEWGGSSDALGDVGTKPNGDGRWGQTDMAGNSALYERLRGPQGPTVWDGTMVIVTAGNWLGQRGRVIQVQHDASGGEPMLFVKVAMDGSGDEVVFAPSCLRIEGRSSLGVDLLDSA